MTEVLDRVRVASVIAVLGSLGALIALITGELTYLEFAAALGAVNIGAGAIGVARNGAGHGVK